MSRDALRKQLVKLYDEGKSVNEICSEYGVPKSTFYRWIRKTRRENPEISDEDIRVIVTKIQKLEEETMTYRKILQILRRSEAV